MAIRCYDRPHRCFSRVKPLVAALTPPEWFVETEEEGERLAEPLLSAVERFVDGGDHSQKRFVTVLRGVLLGPLQDAVEAHRELLQAKGFKGGARAAEEAVREALEDTDDLRVTLIEADDDRDDAEDEEVLTAAFGLRRLLSLSHLKLVAASLLRSSRDKYEYRVTSAAEPKGNQSPPGYTGRRKWHASPDGRHAVLDSVIAEKGKNFSLPERNIGGRKYPAVKNVPFPRFAPSQPREWSGSDNYLSYEFRNDEGELEWR